MFPIDATLTRCRNGRPLVDLNSAPFNGISLRPLELIALARELQTLAHMAVEHASAQRYVGSRRVSLDGKNSPKNTSTQESENGSKNQN